jgi:uncharacterized protein YndB with AHSA1/START domain
MPDILHRVGIDAPAQKVFEAISTINGLQHWWLSDTAGETKLGQLIDFQFCQMEVVESIPSSLVHWRCKSGPEEWLGTEVFFHLEHKRDQTFVIFKHANWKDPVEFMHHCSTKWATFLMSLKGWLETGQGNPTPNDVKIHVGD